MRHLLLCCCQDWHSVTCPDKLQLIWLCFHLFNFLTPFPTGVNLVFKGIIASWLVEKVSLVLSAKEDAIALTMQPVIRRMVPVTVCQDGLVSCATTLVQQDTMARTANQSAGVKMVDHATQLMATVHV